jgi:hypothetical protein
MSGYKLGVQGKGTAVGINRICILGHSGIGKSNLADLFKVAGWEPFRVRVPRDAKDALVCKSPDEFQKLLEELEPHPIYDGGNVKVYDKWSVFKVRGKDQCLEHTPEAKAEHSILRVEIFAPVLVEMLRTWQSLSSAFCLDPARTLIILLNPTSKSFKTMSQPPQELCLSTAIAVSERYRAGGKPVDLADVIQRTEHLSDELAAWRDLFTVGAPVVECLNWAYFEYRYQVSGDTLKVALQAREAVWKAIDKQPALTEEDLLAVHHAL